MRVGLSRQSPEAALPEAEHHQLRRLLLEFAPGRDYFTSYDFSRMRELRPANIFKLHSWLGYNRMLGIFADMVVEEDRHLVPAISSTQCERILLGLAEKDIAQERYIREDSSQYTI